MEDLDFAIPALVEEEQVAESPLLDLPDLGLRLAARQVRHDGPSASAMAPIIT